MLLREDPAYFAQRVAEYAEHRPEQVPTCLKPHPETLNDLERHLQLKTPKFWNGVLQTLVKDTFFDVVFWHDIFGSLEALQQLLLKHRLAINPNTDLPATLENAFAEIIAKLQYFTLRSEAFLEVVVPMCPKLWKKFIVRID